MSGVPPRVILAAHGPPLDPTTWSGTSRQLARSLGRQDALAGTVNAVPRPLRLLEAAASFDVHAARWRQRFHANGSWLSPALRSATSAVARRRVAPLRDEADAVLQVGHWYAVGGRRGGRGLVAASYHDGNLATNLRRPDLLLDRGSRSVRRAVAWERGACEQMDVILTMSDWLRQSFVDDYGQDPERVVTVGVGVNLGALPPVPPPPDPERPRILFLGRSFERKGGPLLLEAFRAVRAARPDAELWIAGPRKQPWSGPREGVRFIGRVSGERAVRELYGQASVFAMPSRYEPFGIVFCEAMAHALPCVGARDCAMPEIVRDGDTGYLVCHGDVDALADRLLTLLGDPGHARRLGLAGRRTVEERWNWDRVAERILAVLGAQLAP